MQIPEIPPKVTNHSDLERQFGIWWRFLNSLGIAAFLMFAQCLGLGEWRYLIAVICCILIFWGLDHGQYYFPPLVQYLRKKGTPAAHSLEKDILKKYIYHRPWAFAPWFIGFFSLILLAFYPALKQNWGAYISPILKLFR